MTRIESFLTSIYSKKNNNYIDGLIYENGSEVKETIACDKKQSELLKNQLRQSYRSLVLDIFPDKKAILEPLIERYIDDNFDNEGHYYLSDKYSKASAESLIKAVQRYFKK